MNQKKATFTGAATTDYLAAMYHFQHFYNAYHAAMATTFGEQQADDICEKELWALRQNLENGLLDSVYNDIEERQTKEA